MGRPRANRGLFAAHAIAVGVMAFNSWLLGLWWMWALTGLAAVLLAVAWWQQHRRIPRTLPLILVALLLLPALTACEPPTIPVHPQPLRVEAPSGTADGWCVVGVAASGASAIYTFAEVPLNAVAVALFGVELPGTLASCWSEFDANRFTLRVWYWCGIEAHYFVAETVDNITRVFTSWRCGSDGYAKFFESPW